MLQNRLILSQPQSWESAFSPKSPGAICFQRKWYLETKVWVSDVLTFNLGLPCYYCIEFHCVNEYTTVYLFYW